MAGRPATITANVNSANKALGNADEDTMLLQ